ncbi:MAG: orotate phosphoribosyltransferase [Gammaproteobacteria bacterium]|jgi:orotate phosphoribosyltransferase|nr:orotate phosphoribosyltransferase [Gammaproteobacteria bacterium]
MELYQKAFIELALEHQALRFGEFTLKSGRISPYFFNVGQLNTGEVLKTIGESYAGAINHHKFQFDVLFGPAYKGIPLACSTAIALSANHQTNAPYSFNRKEAKDHGEGGVIIGAPLKGRVLIIDDVITAGTAIRESFLLIQSQQASIAGIIVALDRQEKGQGNLSAIQEIEATFHTQVKAIITFADIMEYVQKEPLFAEYIQPMQAYRSMYGID